MPVYKVKRRGTDEPYESIKAKDPRNAVVMFCELWNDVDNPKPLRLEVISTRRRMVFDSAPKITVEYHAKQISWEPNAAS